MTKGVTPLKGTSTASGRTGAGATGAGNDSLELRDGRRDRAQCGAGDDTVRADPFDLLKECETVRASRRR